MMEYLKRGEVWIGFIVLIAGSLFGGYGGSFFAGTSMYWFGVVAVRMDYERISRA